MMIRQWFKKKLPTQDQLKQSRWLKPFGQSIWHPDLWHLNQKKLPCTIAIGLAVGLIPGPLKIMCIAIVSLIWRPYLPLAMIIILYNNPLTIVPIYWFAYHYGRWIENTLFHQAFQPIDAAFFNLPSWDWGNLYQTISQYWHYLLNLGTPLILGLFVLATQLSLIGYLVGHVVLYLKKRITSPTKAHK